LADVALVFPNVELRLPIETAGGSPVNIHLLISPEDTDHIDQARRFLRQLKFDYQGEQYACDRADLMRLGRKHQPSTTEDIVALRIGTNQFKVTPEALNGALKDSTWAQTNIIVAVAGGSRDGTSGLRDEDASLEATRVEIERMSQVMFSSQPSQRAFWLGERAASVEVLETKWNGRKACLHGCDAHSLAKVGLPDEQRYSWIKGDPTFESLRQACIEPGERAFVGEQPPSGALDYHTISAVSVGSAAWLATPDVPLNRGLVAIIGARGSGKTALADCIAAAAGAATIDRMSGQSFLRRASAHLSGSTATLSWADGATTQTSLPPTAEPDSVPTVQYLSQQFVEQLCSAEGMTDDLRREIERVVYQAHAPEQRLGASDFQELLAIKAGSGRMRRRHAHEEIDHLGQQIEAERNARDRLPQLNLQHSQLQSSVDADKKVRQGLIVVGGVDRALRLEAINEALAGLRTRVDRLARRETALVALSDATADITSRRLPGIRESLEQDHADAGLTPTEWSNFDISFRRDPMPLVNSKLAGVREELQRLQGEQIPKPTQPLEELAPFVADDADLGSETVTRLRVEAWRLGGLIGLDAAKTRQLAELNRKIEQAEGQLRTLAEQIHSAEGASERIADLAGRRRLAYANLFDGFAEEQAQLEQLYGPIKDVLGESGGTLAKLEFTVRRIVDVEAWAKRGEGLLDLRAAGRFRGRGELLKVARAELLSAWESGSSEEVASAMAAFRDAHDRDILAHARVSREDPIAYRQWGAEISDWLNSTDHITIRYGVQYDGVDIEQLSPGTRGIVLLLLYLSLDSTDDRPLVIDQPEESLDPKSVFDELVSRFRSARSRRQIIIVTHNANLVVNTDADQVIIAEAGSHQRGHLPEIRYTSGGLENPLIREQVCEILEGGKRAFEERARRLRFRLA
jgi:ABC-type lipoprotein export system ATPase subunit